MKSWQWIIFGSLLGLAAAAVIYLVASPPRGAPIVLTPVPTQGEMIVQISGAVVSPGVYHLPRQSRVADIVQAAGGFTTDADQAAINLAVRVNDGQQIVIPTKSEQTNQQAPAPNDNGSGPSQSDGAPSAAFPLDLNIATSEELQALPSIGPTKAADIISYRLQHGPFVKIEDIQNVPGIGPSTFDKIKDLIIVSE